MTPTSLSFTRIGTARMEVVGKADLLGDVGIETGVVLDVVDDEGGVLFRHPAGDSFPHVDGVLLDAGALRPEGDLEVELVVLRVDQHERGGLSLGELGRRSR